MAELSRIHAILPSVVGHMTARRKVADTNLVGGFFFNLHPNCSCGQCGNLGRNTGEGAKVGRHPSKVTLINPSLLLNVLVQSAKPGCKRTVKKSSSFSLYLYVKHCPDQVPEVRSAVGSAGGFEITISQ
jgi:hypothetical protein